MDKFVLRKRKEDTGDGAESASESDIPSTVNVQKKQKTDTEDGDEICLESGSESCDSELNDSRGVYNAKLQGRVAAARCVNRRYNDKYLSMGFTWVGDTDRPIPECIVCGDKLSNEAMVPSKLKRHFAKKHGQLSDKHIDYFRRMLNSRSKQASHFVKKVTISDKA